MLDKIYNPKNVEDKIYGQWLDGNYFHAEPAADKTKYTIVIPPPNITGQLHMGHALDNTLQDILIRWRRMQGYCALWMPGTDHASIATEAKIVAALEAEGTSKTQIGREAFLKRAWEWRALYGGRIIEQLKKLGCSCDWERERFTMDEGLSAAVLDVFVRLYNDGLIYKGERIINWCPGCRTSISDIEVVYNEHDGMFWYLRYPVIGEEGGYISVATTRPETMLGDTAVAVHPDDPRYAGLIGKKALLPLMNREIPIIADEYVDSSLGSGAVKITPAHDPNDYEVGIRHGLEQIRVIDDAGYMNGNAGAYRGLSREAARAKVAEDLRALGLIEKTERHEHNIGECSRCQTIIEPLISSQWFVKMQPLAGPAIDVVRNGETRFVPDRFAKTYYNWMENIQDWCISRQLWWGHRIPAYYCDACGAVAVAAAAPAACDKCGGPLRQDPDVLDTWFSSALWPFSTLGWPEDTAEFKYFYPTDVLVTGYDIIFFWVARMIFSGVRHTGRTPFKYVYIHGMLRDEQGRKMSKSLGNGIDPLEIVEEYGADALRFALTIGNAPGNDLRLSEDKVKAARNFANKLWNASRFVLSHLEAPEPGACADDANLTAADRWILSELSECAREAGDNLERFELGVALQKIYDFIWDVYCDWYIEIAKPRLAAQPGADGAGRAEALLTLRYVLIESLKLLHPFMPFITEEIYGTLSRAAKAGGRSGLCAAMAAAGDEDGVIVSRWPSYGDAFAAEEDARQTAIAIEVIRAIRNLRAEMKVPPSRKAGCAFVASRAEQRRALEGGRGYIEKLAGLSSFAVRDDAGEVTAGDATLVAGGVAIYLPLGELVDIENEKQRLGKELSAVEAEIERAAGRLENPGFIRKAPEKVIGEEREKLSQHRETRAKIAENIKRLSNY